MPVRLASSTTVQRVTATSALVNVSRSSAVTRRRVVTAANAGTRHLPRCALHAGVSSDDSVVVGDQGGLHRLGVDAVGWRQRRDGAAFVDRLDRPASRVRRPATVELVIAPTSASRDRIARRACGGAHRVRAKAPPAQRRSLRCGRGSARASSLSNPPRAASTPTPRGPAVHLRDDEYTRVGVRYRRSPDARMPARRRRLAECRWRGTPRRSQRPAAPMPAVAAQRGEVRPVPRWIWPPGYVAAASTSRRPPSSTARPSHVETVPRHDHQVRAELAGQAGQRARAR